MASASSSTEEHNLLTYSSSNSSSAEEQEQQATEYVTVNPPGNGIDLLDDVTAKDPTGTAHSTCNSVSLTDTKSVTMRSLLRLHWAPLLLMWLAHAAIGAANALPGSCLLALASRVGASLSAMGLWFTVKSGAACLLAVATGFALPWLPKSRQRLAFLAAANLVCAGALLAVPMARSLWAALGLSGVLGAGQSAIETADGILAIVLFGSQHSRPVLQSLHLAVALGALSAPALLHPFRNWQPPAAEAPPASAVAIATANGNSTLENLRLSLCQAPSAAAAAVANYSTTSTAAQPVLHWPILIPFSVVHAAQALAAVGFLALLIRRHRLAPPSQPAVPQPATSKSSAEAFEVLLQPRVGGKSPLPLWRRRLLVALTVAFYFCFVGVENVFWSFINAYGVCSRLRLTALNAAFFAGFLAGRCVGVAVARCVRPALLLLVDLAACQVSLATLCILAGDSPLAAGAPSWLTSAATAVFGLAVASIYAGGISWLEERLNVAGPLACSWTIGSQLGVSVLPALAGHLMLSPSVGPAGVLHLALVGFTAACACFAGMMAVAQPSRQNRTG